jgi:hypothetical protein
MKRRDLLKFLAVAPVASLVKSDNKTVIEKPIEIPTYEPKKYTPSEKVIFTIAGTDLIGVFNRFEANSRRLINKTIDK